MKFDFVEPTSSHVYDVIGFASDVTLSEIRHAGTTKWKLTKDTIDLLGKSRAITLRHEGEPIFVFGHTQGITHKTRLTWFVAKQKYFDLGPRGVLLARNYLRTVKVSWPDTCFESYSYSDHKDCERWFELLGFKRHYPYDSTPMSCRVFRLETGKPAAPRS